MIQLRNVSETLHRRLKMRAVEEGVSLSDLLIREAERLLQRPTAEQIRERLENLKPYRGKLSPATIIRSERDRR